MVDHVQAILFLSVGSVWLCGCMHKAHSQQPVFISALPEECGQEGGVGTIRALSAYA